MRCRYLLEGVIETLQFQELLSFSRQFAQPPRLSFEHLLSIRDKSRGHLFQLSLEIQSFRPDPTGTVACVRRRQPPSALKVGRLNKLRRDTLAFLQQVRPLRDTFNALPAQAAFGGLMRRKVLTTARTLLELEVHQDCLGYDRSIKTRHLCPKLTG
jgi:hypothetical protein